MINIFITWSVQYCKSLYLEMAGEANINFSNVQNSTFQLMTDPALPQMETESKQHLSTKKCSYTPT